MSAGSLLNAYPASGGGMSRPTSGVGRRAKREGLTGEEVRMLRQTRREFAQRGGFVRLFPAPDSMDLYG